MAILTSAATSETSAAGQSTPDATRANAFVERRETVLRFGDYCAWLRRSTTSGARTFRAGVHRDHGWPVFDEARFARRPPSPRSRTSSRRPRSIRGRSFPVAKPSSCAAGTPTAARSSTPGAAVRPRPGSRLDRRGGPRRAGTVPAPQRPTVVSAGPAGFWSRRSRRRRSTAIELGHSHPARRLAGSGASRWTRPLTMSGPAGIGPRTRKLDPGSRSRFGAISRDFLVGETGFEPATARPPAAPIKAHTLRFGAFRCDSRF
jgi:hypothetical protein